MPRLIKNLGCMEDEERRLQKANLNKMKKKKLRTATKQHVSIIVLRRQRAASFVKDVVHRET